MEIDKTDVLFIINVNSGTKEMDSMARELKLARPEYTYFISYSKRMLSHYMKFNASKFSVIVAVGGDGTVQSLLPYIVGTKKILAVIPYGSGNGFARELGFKVDLHKFWRALTTRNYMQVDILEINKFYCINVAGVGYDSFVTHAFNKVAARGLITYIKVAVAAYFKFKNIHAKVENDDITEQGIFMMISIANTRQFGNNAVIAPHANYSDGKYELVLVKPMPFFALLRHAYLLMTGKLKQTKYVRYIQTTEETIIHTNLNKIHVDGDAKKTKGTIRVNILPKAIRVLSV